MWYSTFLLHTRSHYFEDYLVFLSKYLTFNDVLLIFIFPWLFFIFSFLSRWQEQTFHSWTSILLKWYARKQKIWVAKLEFTNNNRCFLYWSCWVWEKLTENSCHFILLAWKRLHKKICLVAQIWKDESAQCNHATNFSTFQ